MTELLWLLVLLLGTRMVYLTRDTALSLPTNVALLLVQLAGLLAFYSVAPATLIAAVVIAVAALVNVLTERWQFELARGWRLISLLILLLGLSCAHSATGGLSFSTPALAVGGAVIDYLPLFAVQAGSVDVVYVLFGLLLLANETNILIRAVFHHLGLDPAAEAKVSGDRYEIRIDERDYRAGRAIGILERWLMFLVVLSAPNLTALGFIIAAKGLARMKQLEQPKFAEYLLVGTLLSAFFSIVIGWWVLLLS